MRFAIILLAALLFLAGCKSSQANLVSEAVSLDEKAQMLAQKYIITVGPVDLPYRLKIKNFRLEREFLDMPIETDEGDFDYVRSKAGGLDAPFMSIYLPSSNQEVPGSSKKLADTLINMVEGIAKAHPDKFVVAHTPDDCYQAHKAGKIALPMGMENGSGIEADIKNVKYFRDRGISYVTLTHAKANLICDSSYDTLNTWDVISPYG